MFNKRGISAIVATVLIILITVSAVGILWAAVIPMIQTALDFSSLQGRVTILNQGYTAYDSTNKIAMVQVKRDVDEGVMNRIKISFDVGGNSHSSSVVAPASGNTKVYYFSMEGIGEPESVSVAPIFVSGKREKEGDVTSEVDIPSSTLGEVGAVVYEVGVDYTYEMPMTGLVSWWKFDGDVKDSVGGNDLTFGGSSFVSGNNGQSYNFLDGGITAGTFEENTVPIISYSFWFKLPDISDLSGTFLAIEDFDNEELENNLGQSSYGVRGCNSVRVEDSSFNVQDSEWHMYFFSNSENSLLCLDGECSNIGDFSNNIPTMKKITFNIGVGCGYGDFDQGLLLDDVMIYSRALSENEVKSIYELQKA